MPAIPVAFRPYAREQRIPSQVQRLTVHPLVEISCGKTSGGHHTVQIRVAVVPGEHLPQIALLGCIPIDLARLGAVTEAPAASVDGPGGDQRIRCGQTAGAGIPRTVARAAASEPTLVAASAGRPARLGGRWSAGGASTAR